MTPTVVLFDIDGTLLSTGGAGRRSMERAFAEVCGRKDACAHFGFDGMTDRAIARAGLAAVEHPTEAHDIDRLLNAYLRALETEVAAADAARYRVHPGVREAVAAATERGFAVGLGTGNVEAGARLKLARVGLDGAFAFGGFGCDHEDRTELIRVGAQRGAQRLGVTLEACRVLVVGDTPKDVLAAHGIGAECLAVGTGSFFSEQLLQTGARWVFPELNAPGAIDALLG